ncbi:phage tail tape measure protein [Salipiger abyssi]|uniref:Phage tail tape measure protein, TP901 family n=1 Tax=Salipiger abyssi TaxID=1250539 RepID=A0A1P8UWI4_9RHOB|nr:phage tail tape measure protein [Salipiger abyssi]APZ53748.1 phage tail tape measure protein, TP901 family [Salipiger abyssi]
MSRTERQYTIRLSAAGQRQLEADLKSLGASGQRSLRLIQNAARPASAGMRETDVAARQLKGSLASVSAELPALSRLARFMGTTAIAGGLVAFGKSSLDVGRQFQAMMQRVQAATRAGEDDLSRLETAAKRLGATTAFTAMEAAGGIEVLAKNGVAIPEILGGALDSSLALASALGAELAPSADLITDLMQQFGLQAGQLPEIVDRLTGAALTSKFGFDDLRMAIGQAGGVAGTSGVEIEDFLAALSATAASFASGSDAGTSFKTFLQRLTPDSKKAAAVMQDLGLEFFDTAGNMKTMEQIAGELQKGLAGLSEEARNEALKTVFGTDAIRTAAALANTGAEGFRDLSAAIAEVSAQEQAEVRLRGLDGALKEVAAAWEALQLESAQNGGLDVAETAVRRLTDALRFLTENFAEVEETAERVAQALVVYLVGRGMTLVVAKAVAMRAALIEIAGAASGVGTAASRAVGPLGRLGVAWRALTGVLGGPLSLAITVASIAALGVDTDVAADAIERAEAAAERATEALDAYQEASKRAAEEQKTLGGEVSAATQAMLNQSRAALEQAKADVERTYAEARDAMSGSMFDGDGIDDFVHSLSRYRPNADVSKHLRRIREELRNDLLAGLAESGEAFEAGEISAREFVAEMDMLRAVGENLEPVRGRLVKILESGDALVGNGMVEELAAAARQAGLFSDEIAALEEASGEVEMAAAIDDLVKALTEALEAGRVLRAEEFAGFRKNIEALADLEKQRERHQKRLEELHAFSEEMKTDRPFDEAADSAKSAADEVDRLNRVYGAYQSSRAHSNRVTFARGAADAAKKGLRDLIGYAEGTDKGRGYNETLGYGKFTGGDVNPVSMTLDEVLALQKRMLAHPDNDYNSSAVGRYQIVSKTLRSLMEEMGLSGNERFSENLQDQMADILIERRGRSPSALRNEWEGLRRVSDEKILTAYDAGAGKRAEDLTEAARERADALEKVFAVGRDQIEQLQLEADLAGRTVEEQARLTFQYEALKRAREAGIDPQKALAEDGRVLIDVINEQAVAYGRLVAAREEEQRTAEEQKADIDGYASQISGVFDNLKPGGAGVEAFWNDLTQMILDKLWSLALDPVWEQLAVLMDQAFSGIGGSVANVGYSASAGTMASAGLYQDGGGLPKRAGGGGFRDVPRAVGKLQGLGGKRQDNLLFWGSRGEFMQPAAAVDHYGIEFMEAIRTMRLPKFADGGSLAGVASGSTSPATPAVNMPITNEDHVGVRIERQKKADGSMRLAIRDALRDEIRGGGVDSAMRDRYGTRPKPRGQ